MPGDRSQDQTAATAELFAAGNFAAVAGEGATGDWYRYAALGLLGRPHAAWEGLRRFDHLDAQFYAAVAAWMDGDEDTAARMLEPVPTPFARNLLALIRQPQIRVLVRSGLGGEDPLDLLGGAAADGKFRLQDIDFEARDLSKASAADILRFADGHLPDFCLCAMLERRLVPPSLHALPCPVLGQVTDYERHIQVISPWLPLFDALVVADRRQWQDLFRLVSVPVWTFPKSCVLPDRLPPLPEEARRFDVAHTGSVIHPYFPEAGELLQQILSVPNLAFRWINGSVGAEDRQALLASSRVVPTYVGQAGAMPTQGVEALAMGCAVLVQRDSALTLFAGEGEGVLTYDLREANLPSVLRQILDAWPEFQDRARRGAGLVRREFAATRVASQYLRFLTVLAARPGRPRRRIGPDALDRKRPNLWQGWTADDPEVIRQVQERNLARWRRRLDEAPCPRLYIDMAREIVLAHAADRGAAYGSPVAEETISQVLRFCRAGMGRFPASLVLRFNLIRVSLHFGRPPEVLEALHLAGETLAQPASSWELDVLEDVFPWDFCNTFFNYRTYLDLVTEHLAWGREVRPELIRLILASLHFYLAHYSGSLAAYRRAATADPVFPYYRLGYARALLDSQEAGHRREAEGILGDLMAHSNLFMEAGALLEIVLAADEPLAPRATGLRATLERAAACVQIPEPAPAFPLRPAPVSQAAGWQVAAPQDRHGDRGISRRGNGRQGHDEGGPADHGSHVGDPPVAEAAGGMAPSCGDSLVGSGIGRQERRGG
jgi:tetratricopeptide (TPR) repeat protein